MVGGYIEVAESVRWRGLQGASIGATPPSTHPPTHVISITRTHTVSPSLYSRSLSLFSLPLPGDWPTAHTAKHDLQRSVSGTHLGTHAPVPSIHRGLAWFRFTRNTSEHLYGTVLACSASALPTCDAAAAATACARVSSSILTYNRVRSCDDAWRDREGKRAPLRPHCGVRDASDQPATAPRTAPTSFGGVRCWLCGCRESRRPKRSYEHAGDYEIGGQHEAKRPEGVAAASSRNGRKAKRKAASVGPILPNLATARPVSNHL